MTNEQFQILLGAASLAAGEVKRYGEWVTHIYTAKIGGCTVQCSNPIIAGYINNLQPYLVLEILQDYERLREENAELKAECERLENECARFEETE